MNPHHHLLRNALLFLSLHHHLLAFSSDQNLLLPSDASALLRFKSAADLRNRLNFSAKTSFAFCKWRGVECSDSRAIRIVVENMNLGGVFAPNSLSQLGELRVLSLQNNTLTGPIPSLSSLINLKVLFLSHNYFSGAVPPSISTLHRLKTVDLSFNMLAGSIPVSLNGLDRLYYLRLDFNRFNGSVPAFNQSSLQIFNVSHNDLSGAIPVTPTLSRFNETSFASNSALCGEIIHKQCRSTQPFFGLPANIAAAPPPAAALKQTAVTLSGKGGVLQKHKRAAFAIGLSLAASFFVVSILCIAVAARKRRNSSEKGGITKSGLESSVTGNAEAVMRIEEENDELAEKVKRLQEVKQQLMVVGKSGNLMFCAGESPAYTIDQLMRASAELLGRGTTGTTYKAVLDSRLIVTVKRLDGARFAAAKPEIFEGHMRSVGGLRHPNLVPLRAYFQAKEERILIYDYHANGSLSSLIHGSKLAKAKKPLHWTSCLKIAEDAAQGLCYIHQAWRLVHGNLKSSNVLLGSDFEACLTDYCLVALAGPADDEEAYYTAPEVVKSGQRGAATSKSDVYSFGVLLLELLSGQHPSVGLDEMVRWMRSVRAEEGEERLEMMLEVAMACSVVSPEQRPTMWQVLKMVQEIKEVVMMEDCEFDFKPEVV